MANRTCSVTDCGKEHRARGFCVTHYNQALQPDRHRKLEAACAQCGDVVLKPSTARYANRFCSLLCRDVHRNAGMPTLSHLPASHPVSRLIRGMPADPPPTKPRPKVRVRVVDCEWCGVSFTTTKTAQRMCSPQCKLKAKRVRRIGRARGWASHYTWAEVMRIHLAMHRQCAYCHVVVEGEPDPDHVVPLSRGGSNSVTNILPCCRACNSDKRDLLLGEWNADRLRRGLDERTTSDPRWLHLTSLGHAA